MFSEEWLEYIQCQHCSKKYAVSEKLRSAAGRKIRCKHCQQVFEIAICSDEPAAATASTQGDVEEVVVEPAVSSSAVDQAGSDITAERESEEGSQAQGDSAQSDARPLPKKSRVQLMITITLTLLLIAAATVAGLYFYQPELFRPAQKAATDTVMPAQLVDPMLTNRERQTALQRDAGADGDQRHGDQPSQACKDAAAEYWLRTRVLATTKLETKAYMQLLEMNLEQAEQIRQWCHDKDIVSRVAKAARAGEEPEWIAAEIRARSQMK